MDQKVLLLDAQTGFYKVRRYPVGRFFGPVDLGLHLSSRTQSINIGVGLLAGSIFPGSNRLFVTGFSPCWRGFYVSSMGGAGLVFDNLGINSVSIIGKCPVPSVLFLDAATGFYRIRRYPVGRFFGPVDLGLHISAHHQSLNIGVGLLAGSIFPGSNRLFVTGFSPCWRGFFVS